MTSHDHTTGDERNRAARPRSRLFTVRLWTEEVAGGREYRGSVRDVLGGAFRGFREWSDLTDFLATQIEDAEDAHHGRAEGGPGWPQEERC